MTTFDIDQQKQRAALVSVAVKVVLTIAKFVAAALSGSLALLSEAGNNLCDVGVTLLSLYSIRVAAQPADEDHPFGHGKVEAVAALRQTGFLIALAIFILIEAVKRLVDGNANVEAGAFPFAVLAVSMVVDAARWWSLRRVAKATNSPALAADALNFATDIVASALAVGGLVATYDGLRYGDAVAAIGVALFVGIAGFQLARGTVDLLIDTAPKGLSDPVRALIEGVQGVIAVGALRLRPVDHGVGGDVVISVSRTLSLDRVAAIREAVTAALARAYPAVSLGVTVQPIALDDETVVERVLFIARKRQVPIHHVTVQALGRRQSVSFDAEIDGRMPLGRAHEVVTALELAIAAELGDGFEIESHIEPLELKELAGRDCDGTARERVEAALRRRAPEGGMLWDVHDVRVRETEAGLVVNYHCLVDPEHSVDAVHAHVDALDRRVRLDYPAVARIVGHAEPVKTHDHG